MPAAGASDHEFAKIASLPVAATVLVSGEHFGLASATDDRPAASAAVGLYILTHAFLI
jgi:hypothetical protein